MEKIITDLRIYNSEKGEMTVKAEGTKLNDFWGLFPLHEKQDSVAVIHISSGFSVMKGSEFKCRAFWKIVEHFDINYHDTLRIVQGKDASKLYSVICDWTQLNLDDEFKEFLESPSRLESLRSQYEYEEHLNERGW